MPEIYTKVRENLQIDHGQWFEIEQRIDPAALLGIDEERGSQGVRERFILSKKRVQVA